MSDVEQAKSLGHQQLDTPAPKLLGRVSKQATRRGIGECDGARFFDNHRCIRSPSESAVEQLGRQHRSDSPSAV
jgi:hypothetical protein